jgi:hypothetical protein
LIALALGGAVAQSSALTMLLAACAVAIFVAAFVNAEWGLTILILSMLLSPEISAGETGRGTLGRGVTLRLEDALLVLIGMGWFARNAVFKDLGLFRKTPLNRPIFIYMVVCVLSTGFGFIGGRVELKTGALYVLKYFEYFIVFFMTVNHARDVRQIRRFLVCLFATAAVVAVIGLFQIPSGERTSAPFEGHGGEPNTFGGYLLFIGMVAAGIAAKVKAPRVRNLMLLLIGVIALPLLFTQSRSSYLGVLVAAFTLSLLVERRLIVVGLVAVGLLVSPLFLPDVVTERVKFTFSQPEEPGQIAIGDLRLDTSTSARIQSWGAVLRDFHQHPLLGFGVTGYAFVDAQLPRVLIETGLLGAAAFLYLLASIFRVSRQRLREAEDPLVQGLAAGFLAGFVGLVAHSLGANTFNLVRIMEPFWFLAGVIVVLPAVRPEAPPASPALRPAARSACAARRPSPQPLRLP